MTPESSVMHSTDGSTATSCRWDRLQATTPLQSHMLWIERPSGQVKTSITRANGMLRFPRPWNERHNMTAAMETNKKGKR